MLAMTTPAGVRALADRFKDLLFSYTDFCALLSLFIFGCSSLCEIVRRGPWTRSVSSLSRSIDKIPANRLMRRLRRSILNHYGDEVFDPEHFAWAIDDTANPKFGKTVFRSGHWCGSSGPWMGQKVMVLGLVDLRRGISLPVAYVIAPKKGTPGYKKGHELAIDLLKIALDAGLPPLPVTVDSWFDSIELMDAVQNLGMTYVGELKSNRKVRRNPGRYVPWTNMAAAFHGVRRIRVHTRFDSAKVKSGRKRAKVAARVRLWIRGRSAALNVIAVYNRRNGRDAFGYYASTDLSMSPARIWEISRARWKIEVMFRDLKQHLSFGKLPCGGESGADVAVCLPMLILVSLRLHAKLIWGFDDPGTIGDMIDQIRERSLSHSIDHLVSRKEGVLTERLRARRASHRLNKKPVNRFAEAS